MMLVRENAATPFECQTIIEAFKRCQYHYTHEVPGDTFFDHRVMWYSSWPPAEIAARTALRRLQDQGIAWMQETYQEPALYVDGTQTVLWPGGVEMTPHQDDRHPDGSPHGTPWRKLAGVYYLNDDYDGGQIWFPEHGRAYKPVRGTFLGFPGAWWHGVRAASAPRYTVIAWYTDDISRRDPRSIGPI